MPIISFPKWMARYSAFLWTAGIFFATLMPAPQVPSPGIDWPIDKVVHFFLFFGFGILWMRGLYVRFQKRVIWVIGAGILVGISTELLQAIMPYGRTGTFGDILANLTGLMAGVGVFRIWFHHYRQPA